MARDLVIAICIVGLLAWGWFLYTHPDAFNLPEPMPHHKNPKTQPDGIITDDLILDFMLIGVL
jgi:hypothetical protein